jgi:hypothetical protein
MIPYIMLVFAIAAPVALRIYGRRWLGSQTHPAAVFILSWMASALLLGYVDFITVSTGAVAVLIVTAVFCGFTIVDKLRKRNGAKEAPKND